ncbi:MAG: hypothetical protein A2W93_07150 [Bacteroidetes bacterium GWF2_43_63]|nr:MAG: hypothetical protein A2W94_09730 [Bacteroidetes bacterium GWE2_42_42]OFY53786.1 MAG: hypothetical protein A2W93_07150 [Bacteroidetes bacterium GWF2_43_63]HCB61072.1 hypothetical protein [Bacteroidales bacterium]HCY24194.1 hypothetical protein [Bacteroidales bacterium]
MKYFILSLLALVFAVSAAKSQTIVLNEDFESAPYDLTSSGPIAWGINSRLHASGSFSDTCTLGLTSTSYLTTPAFSTTGNTSVVLEFKQICKIESGDAGQIEYSIDGGATWTLVTISNYLGVGSFASNKFTEFSYPTTWAAGVGATVPQNTWWKTEQFDLSGLVGNQASVKIRFKLSDGNNNGANQRTGWSLDDVKVTIAPSELIPPTITLLPLIYQDTVFVNGPFEIKAAISDASGIASATLSYSINGGASTNVPMTVILADTFHATIPAQAYNTRIDYTISAIDAALAANTGSTTGNWFFVKKPAPVAIIGTGTASGYEVPVNAFYDYSWSEQIYTATEIGMSGIIDSIFFQVASTPTPFIMPNQDIYISSSPVSEFLTSAFPDTTQMTRIFTGTYTFTATGWAKIPVTVPYFYDGTGNIHIVWINKDGDYDYTYPEFYYTTTTGNLTQYDSQDYSFPSGAGTLSTDRPNLKIAFRSNNNSNDVAMHQITEPFSTPTPTTGTPYPVKTIFRNLGANTVTSLTLNWSVDGILQTPYPWTGSLLQDQNSAEILLGNVTFTGQGSHQIKVWSSLPNGVADEGPVNDTILKNYFVCNTLLAGNYTINPVVPTGGANFQYFADAVGALSNCGISDTTVFNIVPGTYTTLISLPEIPGAGPNANVTFQSSTGVATDVVLQNTATSSSDNYIFNLNGTDYFSIRNLSIQALGATHARCIALSSGCENIIIEGNNIAGANALMQDNNLDLIFKLTSSNDSNIVIRNNNLQYGSTAMNLITDFAGLSHNISITGNTITDYYYAGIQVEYCSGITIDTNIVSSGNTSDYAFGVNVYESDNVDIRMNRIYNAKYAALYLFAVTNSAADRGSIINNFVSAGGTGDAYGIYFYECTNFNVYHNSVNCYSSGSNLDYAFYSNYGVDNEIFNNIFANTGSGYAIGLNNFSDTANYNNLYTTGSNLAVFDYNDYANLASYQTASAMDANSISSNPIFISNTELHTIAFGLNNLGFGVGVSNDIDGEVRNVTTPEMGADEFTPPLQEAGIVSHLSPMGGCGLAMESIGIQIACNGLNAINGNLTAYYSVDGGTPVSQAISTQILSGDTLDFTFSTLADLSVGATDHVFEINTWIALTGDPIAANDTLLFSVTSLHSPAPVVVSNATIPYGTAATLTATSTDTIQWYADPALITLLETGTSYTTPVLYDTTIYFVASTSGVKYNYTFETDLQGWSALAPCASYTTYNWGWNSDAGVGTALMVDQSSSSGAMLLSPVFNVFGTDVSLTFTHRFETESCCDHGYVAYRLDGGAWNQFEPSTGGYNYDDGLNVDPAIGSCNYYEPAAGVFSGSSGYMTTSGQILLNGGTQLEIAFVFSSDGSVGAEGWFIDEVTVEKAGCPGQVKPDTVFVTGAPSVDVGVIAIDSPNDGIDLTNNETVTVRVKNYGTTAASNIPVNYTINAGTAVTGSIAGPVNPGDTATYTFAAGANLSTFATYEIAAYTTLSGDLYPVNDTVKKQVVNSPLTYCESYAENAGDEDIGNVTLSGLNNTSPTPYSGTYTDYTTTVAPAYLALGQTYPISITVVTGGSDYSGYSEVYIDYNHDGVFTEPAELAFGSAYTTQPQVLTGNITVPLTAVSGTTTMRVVVQESNDAAETEPCNVYYYGETEDYLVTIAPQIPDDAGVVSIDSPDYIQAENSLVPVVVTVRNFGTNTLTTIPVEYIANGGAPVAFTWNGSLAPNATTQITLPDVTVVPDSNEICAYTLVVNDTNTFNDNACAWFYGLPPAIMFEDDMENGTQLYTDAPTLWEHGVPAASIINIAHSPDNVWTTNLDGDYPISASGFIYTPNINFFGVSGAYLTFYYWIEAQENSDGGYAQYTNNNGATWTSLGSINDPNGFNWFESYVSGTPGWSKATNGWKPAFIKLDAVSGYSIVKFRFGFKSNTTINNNGFAIDDIKILGPAVAIDGGIVEIVAPATSTTTGAATTVTVKIKNLGTDTLTSVPVSYKLNTGFPPQNGTWTGTLLPDSTVNYTFTQTYPGPSINYELCAYTNVSGDPYRGNDTACVSFNDIIGLEEATFNGVTLLQNVPNPASAQTEISFTLPAPGKCVLTLRNTLGELIQTTTIDGQSGKNSVNVDLSRLGQGIYVYTLEYKDVVLTRRLSVIK